MGVGEVVGVALDSKLVVIDFDQKLQVITEISKDAKFIRIYRAVE